MTPPKAIPPSAADIWHDRLTQLAHRLACIAILLIPAAFFPQKVAPEIAFTLPPFLAAMAVLYGLSAVLFLWPDEGDGMEAIGATIFAAVVLVVAVGVALMEKMGPVIKQQSLSWLRLDALPNWGWRCAIWAGMLLVILWIVITSALTRKGR